MGGGGPGGVGAGAGVANNSAARFWRKVKCHGQIPGPRSGAASVIVDTKMYMFGGYGGSGRLDDFYEFDFETKGWVSWLVCTLVWTLVCTLVARRLPFVTKPASH